MDERKRQQNERKFGTWRELADGGRLYSYEVKGRYDDGGTLREVHHKYPVDLGHRQALGDEP